MVNEVVCYLVNSLCSLLYSRDYRTFMQIKDVKSTQEEKLLAIISANKESEYGRRYAFSDIKNIKVFQNQVPLTDYEDYIPYIEKIMKGEQGILTEEEVLLLELSSGSASASKYIPYTKSLKNEFQKGIRPWLFDLYSTKPELKRGKSYWSITPAVTKNQYSEGGIPIGFEDDKAYFGSLEKKLLDRVMVVPSKAAECKNIEAFYFRTSMELLKCSGLRLISIWNPSFLILILDFMHQHSEKLTDVIKDSDSKRAAEVKEILEKQAYHRLWKNLRLISCWSDANAAKYADRLSEMFPGVAIQPKGLLATEGFVSFPLTAAGGAVLSLKSHFFEFRSEENETIVTADCLERGKKYSVILTTSGGLYRYRLKDVIEIKDFYKGIPVITFLGKLDKVSDLFGEKLNEVFVKNILERLGINKGFYMLAPETDRYVLYIENVENFGLNTENVSLSAESIDEAMRENFHYDYCRKLGQLKELRLFRLTGNPEKEYMEECVRRGQRLGDIKPTVLFIKGGWDKVFKGEYL